MIHGTRFGGIWWALAFEPRCLSCALLIWVLAFRTLQALCGIAACRSLVKCGCFCFLGVCFSWESTFFKGQPARLLFASGQGHMSRFPNSQSLGTQRYLYSKLLLSLSPKNPTLNPLSLFKPKNPPRSQDAQPSSCHSNPSQVSSRLPANSAT